MDVACWSFRWNLRRCFKQKLNKSSQLSVGLNIRLKLFSSMSNATSATASKQQGFKFHQNVLQQEIGRFGSIRSRCGFFPQEVGAKIHQKSVALFLGDPQKSRQKRLGFLDSLEVWVLKRRVFLFSDGILGAFKRAPTTWLQVSHGAFRSGSLKRSCFNAPQKKTSGGFRWLPVVVDQKIGFSFSDLVG